MSTQKQYCIHFYYCLDMQRKIRPAWWECLVGDTELSEDEEDELAQVEFAS